MSLHHIAHHLSCPECQGASQCDPPGPRVDGQCALPLDDRDPPAWCPHPHAPGTEFCEIHGKAVAEARAALGVAAPGDPEELAALIAEARRKFLQAQKMLLDAGKQIGRHSADGDGDTALAALCTELDALLDGLLLQVRAGEAELAAMNRSLPDEDG